MAVWAIIQARMGSVRFPGKVLEPILGEPMLYRIVERLRQCQQVAAIGLTTTFLAEDDPIQALAVEHAIPISRGEPTDVLAQYVKAANQFGADVVVRITGDNPLIDPATVDAVITEHLTQGYEATTLAGQFPNGLDTEVFATHVLQDADQHARHYLEREHVGPYIWHHPERYRLGYVRWPWDHDHVRLTVDYPDDLDAVRKIYEVLYPHDPAFTIFDVLSLLRRQPEIGRINQNHARNVGLEQESWSVQVKV